jgi:glutaconate CoA-transferase subunit B
MVLMLHQRRRYVDKLDFITTPGYLSGPGAREAAGLPGGGGPYRVISDLAVMSFNNESKRMQVESLHPGVSFPRVQENTGFEILAAPEVSQTEPPTKEELRILRDEIDPFRYIIGR